MSMSNTIPLKPAHEIQIPVPGNHHIPLLGTSLLSLKLPERSRQRNPQIIHRLLKCDIRFLPIPTLESQQIEKCNDDSVYDDEETDENDA